VSNGPLYAMGGAHPNALDGFATGKRGPERPQEILTPQVVVDFVRLAMDSEIEFDPCAALDPETGFPRGVVGADYYCYETSSPHGLETKWLHGTYCNPPFKHLKAWLAKAVSEASDYSRPAITVLAPTRGHRPWFREARAEALRNGFVLELNPIAFLGYEQVFPAPLSLLAFNCGLTIEARKAGLRLGGFL